MAVVPLAAVVCSQCEDVGGTRGPLDSIRRLGAMGRGYWRPMPTLAKQPEYGLLVVAVVPLAAVVCSQCEVVGGSRGPLDSIRRLGAMGRSRWRPMPTLEKQPEYGSLVVAVVPLAAVVCSQCEDVGGTRGPLDSIRRLGAMGRGRWRPMRR